MWLIITVQQPISNLLATYYLTYYLKPNHGVPGRHVSNCGYMVTASTRGQGMGRLMGKHSLKMAIALGYEAM